MKDCLDDICIKVNKDTTSKSLFDGSHSMPYLQLGLCCDSRKYECPYALHINIDNEFMNFNGTVCGYGVKRGDLSG